MNYRKSHLSIALIMVFMILSPQVVLGLAPAAPWFYISVTPNNVEVEAGGSVTFEITSLSQETFEGRVILELFEPPTGVTATFDPNPVIVPGFDIGISSGTIDVASTVSLGEIEITIWGRDEAGVADRAETELTLTVVSSVASSGAVVAPSAGSGAVVAPSAGSGAVVDPSANSSAVVAPSAGSGAVVAPSAGSGAVVAPSAGSGSGAPQQTVTTTATTTLTQSTTVTTATTITSTTTQIITTKTSSISSKTTLDEFNQPSDIIYPLVTLAGIVVIIGAVIMLRRSKS